MTPLSARRRTVHVELPCRGCLRAPTCTIKSQMEENLTLTVLDVPTTVRLGISCSLRLVPCEENRPNSLDNRRAVRG